MIPADQAIHWLWQQYKEARSMSEIEYWFDRFAINREQQRAGKGAA